MVRKAHEAFAAKGAFLFDAPVSGGPRGAASGKLAIWCGGDEDVFDQWKPVLDMIGDAAKYIGPVGAGSVAKLVHNCFGYIATAAAAEVFSMGVKAGIEPLAIWEAVRQGAIGRRGAFDSLTDQFLPNKYEPPAFALRLAHKDVSLATALGRELNVPMRLANLALADLAEGLNRGWADRDFARDHAVPVGTGRREDRSRSPAADRGVGEQGEERIEAQAQTPPPLAGGGWGKGP